MRVHPHLHLSLITIIATLAATSSTPDDERRILHPALHPWHHERGALLAPHQTRMIVEAMAKQTTLRDGVPFFYNGHRGAALVCLSEKTGSTAWKLLFLKALAGTGRLEEPFLLTQSPHKVKVRVMTPSLPRAEQERLIADPGVPRIMLVRDPYARLLSGYLDKASTARRWQESRLPLPCRPNGGRCYSPGEPFSAFVDAATQAERINAHFELLSKHCLIPDGLTYDYYLKVEEIDFWYPPLIAALELHALAAHGWKRPTKFWPGASECFYASKASDCAGMSSAVEAAGSATTMTRVVTPAPPNNQSTATGQKRATTQTSSGRNQHADSKLGQYFTSLESEKVTAWAARDLVLFGYERWSGGGGGNKKLMMTMKQQQQQQPRQQPRQQLRQQQRPPSPPWKSWMKKQQVARLRKNGGESAG